MSQPSIDVLQQASDYVRRGQPQLAQPLLVEYLKKNSQSAEAWYLLSSCVIDQRHQIDCLQRALRINPAFKEAQARLIEVMTAQPEAPKPASSRPAWVEYQPPPPVEEQPAAPSPEAKPVEPTPPPAAIQVAEPPSDHVEAETLSGLRTELERGEARPRRRRRLRVFLVIVLLIAAAAGGAALLIQRERNRPPVDEAATARAIAALPTVTPTFTPTPTFTSTPTDTPTPLPATWTSTPAPTQAPTHTPSPYPTPNDTVDASMRAIQRQVSAVRGLAIDASSGHYLIQPADVAGVLRSVAKAQGMLDNLPDHARALSALGLIKPTYDLVQYTLNGLADNIGGFYVPATRDAFVAGDRYGPIERYVIAHEFAHVLIDQWYPLENTGAYPCTLDAQRCQAIRALVEGDANLVASQWLKSAPAQDKQAVDDFQPPALILPDEFAPPFILRDLSFMRDMGASFAQALYQRGGWGSLNKAYKNLPLSTEQILHPEKYLAGEKPIEVSLPPLTSTLGEGWRLIEDNVLGEWTTYLMLSSGVDEKTRLKDDVALNATRGWGGDRYHVYYKDATGETALVALWMWDVPLDALEFKQAMIAYLDQRFDRARIDQSDGNCWAVTGQTTCLITTDRSALWLLAPDQSTIDAMRTALH